MKLSARDVDSTLSRERNFYWGSLEYRSDAIKSLRIFGEEYEFEVIESRFGSEGDWHCQTYIVFRLGDQFFRKTGYYASHDGEYWDGPLTEVEGEPTNIIVWRDK